MQSDKKQQREHQRLDVQLAVRIIKDSSAGVEVVGQSLNISAGGMFIEIAEKAFAFGDTVNLQFKLPKTEKPTGVQAIVRWVTPTGIGVQFGSLRAVDVWAINEMFRESEAEELEL